MGRGEPPSEETELQPALKLLAWGKERRFKWALVSPELARKLRKIGAWDDTMCVEVKSTRKERRGVRERSDGTR